MYFTVFLVQNTDVLEHYIAVRFISKFCLFSTGAWIFIDKLSIFFLLHGYQDICTADLLTSDFDHDELVSIAQRLLFDK